MDSWLDYKKLFESVDIYSMLDEIFSQSRVQDEVIRLNQEQLQSGVDSRDKEINTIGGSPYRPYTVKIKKIKGQPTNIVTLYDTGAFYNSFRVKITNQGYEILADFRKDDGDIRDNLPGEFDVLGLTDESLAELVYETILPRLDKMIKQKLNV
jgi:hypothetical protein